MRPIDVRVAASAVVALRFHLDARLADLDEHAAGLERKLMEAVAQRANLELRLRRNEEVRTQALDVLPRLRSLASEIRGDLVACFNQGFALSTQLAGTAERVAGIKERLGDIETEQATLRETGERLNGMRDAGVAEVNLKASRYSQAARQIFQIVDEEHEAMARSILEGPMQRLADAAFEAELVGRALATEPVAAREAASRCRVAAADAAARLAQQVEWLDPVDADRGVVASIRDLLASKPAYAGIRLRVLGAERRLRALAELTIHRIVDEALGNAMAHSHATRVDLIVSFHAGRLIVVVKDDGDGFDVVATEARLGRSRTVGLIEMRERARLVDGRLEIRSIPGIGTEVRLSVPDTPSPS